jgi:hypothetical protein
MMLPVRPTAQFKKDLKRRLGRMNLERSGKC